MRSTRCAYTTSDGRRCTSLAYPGHASLCHHHLSPALRDVPADILSSIHNFQSAAAINAALGPVLALLI